MFRIPVLSSCDAPGSEMRIGDTAMGVDGWMGDGRMDGWVMDKWMDGRTNNGLIA